MALSLKITTNIYYLYSRLLLFFLSVRVNAHNCLVDKVTACLVDKDRVKGQELRGYIGRRGHPSLSLPCVCTSTNENFHPVSYHRV